MVLIITCTLSYDQYRHYPMHSAKHNGTQHWWVHSWVTPFIIVKVSLCYWKRVPQLLIGMPWVIVSDKNSLHCWFLLNEKLVAPTCSESRSHNTGSFYLKELEHSYISNDVEYLCLIFVIVMQWKQQDIGTITVDFVNLVLYIT